MIWKDPAAITSIIKIVGGIILVTQAKNKKAAAAAWSKKVLALSGLTAFLAGLFFVFLMYTGKALPSSIIGYINYYKTLLDGATLGLLLSLFWSGELSLNKWKT
jgi:hypothetical protein